MGKVAMSFRVDENLRNSFIQKCRSEDIPASVAIRELMKGFIGRVPNEVTLQAIRDVENGVNVATFNSVDDLMADLLDDNDA